MKLSKHPGSNVRYFTVGQSVMVRDYRGNIPWIHATDTSCLGPLTYQVKMREECGEAMSIRWGELPKPLQRKPLMMRCNLASLSRLKYHRCRWPIQRSNQQFRVPLHLWKFRTLRWQTVPHIANLSSNQNKSFHRHHLLNDGIRCAFENQQNG